MNGSPYVVELVGEGNQRSFKVSFHGCSVTMPPQDEFFEHVHSRSGCHLFWNVTTARNWLQAGQVQVMTVPTADWSLEDVIRQYPSLDVAYAMQTDLTRPLLVIEGGEANGDLLIDGWNRLYKAIATGAPTVVVGMIHRGWARKILIGWLPGGCPMLHDAIEQGKAQQQGAR